MITSKDIRIVFGSMFAIELAWAINWMLPYSQGAMLLENNINVFWFTSIMFGVGLMLTFVWDMYKKSKNAKSTNSENHSQVDYKDSGKPKGEIESSGKNPRPHKSSQYASNTSPPDTHFSTKTESEEKQ